MSLLFLYSVYDGLPVQGLYHQNSHNFCAESRGKQCLPCVQVDSGRPRLSADEGGRLKIVNPNLRDRLEIEDIKCPMLVNNCHYTLHQALSVYGGLNLRCSEWIRSSLEEVLKHLPGSSGAFLTFAGTMVALMEFKVQRWAKWTVTT